MGIENLCGKLKYEVEVTIVIIYERESTFDWSFSIVRLLSTSTKQVLKSI